MCFDYSANVDLQLERISQSCQENLPLLFWHLAQICQQSQIGVLNPEFAQQCCHSVKTDTYCRSFVLKANIRVTYTYTEQTINKYHAKYSFLRKRCDKIRDLLTVTCSGSLVFHYLSQYGLASTSMYIGKRILNK